jgi:hypothetical protein
MRNMIRMPAYSMTFMSIRRPEALFLMCLMVRRRMHSGHSKYHQTLSLGQNPPIANRLESLYAVAKYSRSMRWLMGIALGMEGDVIAWRIRFSSLRRVLLKGYIRFER